MLGVLYVRGQHFNVIQGKGGGAGVRILLEERARQESACTGGHGFIQILRGSLWVGSDRGDMGLNRLGDWFIGDME